MPKVDVIHDDNSSNTSDSNNSNDSNSSSDSSDSKVTDDNPLNPLLYKEVRGCKTCGKPNVEGHKCIAKKKKKTTNDAEELKLIVDLIMEKRAKMKGEKKQTRPATSYTRPPLDHGPPPSYSMQWPQQHHYPGQYAQQAPPAAGMFFHPQIGWYYPSAPHAGPHAQAAHHHGPPARSHPRPIAFESDDDDDDADRLSAARFDHRPARQAPPRHYGPKTVSAPPRQDPRANISSAGWEKLKADLGEYTHNNVLMLPPNVYPLQSLLRQFDMKAPKGLMDDLFPSDAAKKKASNNDPEPWLKRSERADTQAKVIAFATKVAADLITVAKAMARATLHLFPEKDTRLQQVGLQKIIQYAFIFHWRSQLDGLVDFCQRLRVRRDDLAVEEFFFMSLQSWGKHGIQLKGEHFSSLLEEAERRAIIRKAATPNNKKSKQKQPTSTPVSNPSSNAKAKSSKGKKYTIDQLLAQIDSYGKFTQRPDAKVPPPDYAAVKALLPHIYGNGGNFDPCKHCGLPHSLSLPCLLNKYDESNWAWAKWKDLHKSGKISVDPAADWAKRQQA